MRIDNNVQTPRIQPNFGFLEYKKGIESLQKSCEIEIAQLKKQNLGTSIAQIDKSIANCLARYEAICSFIREDLGKAIGSGKFFGLVIDEKGIHLESTKDAYFDSYMENNVLVPKNIVAQETENKTEKQTEGAEDAQYVRGRTAFSGYLKDSNTLILRTVDSNGDPKQAFKVIKKETNAHNDRVQYTVIDNDGYAVESIDMYRLRTIKDIVTDLDTVAATKVIQDSKADAAAQDRMKSIFGTSADN